MFEALYQTPNDVTGPEGGKVIRIRIGCRFLHNLKI